MNRPRRLVRGNTWLGWLNRALLQWACVRLAYSVDGSAVRWCLLYWAVPGTGWTRDVPYHWIGGTRHTWDILRP